MPRRSGCGVLVITLAVAACGKAASSGTAGEPAADQVTVEVLYERVLAAADDACTASPQCRIMPVGAKPCGGPRTHVVYSSAGTDSAALAGAVARYDSADAARNRELGLASDCMLVGPPSVACVSGTCQEVSAPERPRGERP